ncbi:MAG: hypothetical protein ABGW75_00635, partial [Pirellulales bacterium]
QAKNFFRRNEEDTFMEAFIGIGILCVIFVGFAVAIISGRRHAQAMKHFSETIGFSYMPHVEDDEAFLQQFSRLPLFSRGKDQDVWNIMKGHVQGLEVTIMEFRYSYNSSSIQSTGEISTQTVVIIESDTLNLPSFSLTPQKTSTGLGKKFFSALMPTFSQFIPQDIDFDSHPLFSKLYLLQGTRKNEGAVRKLFNHEVIRYYEIQKDLCTDGAGNTIMCYSLGKELTPEDIPSFLDQTIEVYAMFQRAGHVSSAT